MNNTTVQPPQDRTEFYINQTIRMCLMALSVVAGLLGNAVVVVIMLTKKTPRKNDNIFLLNLACADFLNIALDVVRFVANLSYVRPTEKSLMWCKLYWPLLGVVFLVGISTITAMSLHRCWVIQNPFTARVRLLWIKLFVLGIWVIAILVYLPLTIAMINEGTKCIYQRWSNEDKSAYVNALAIAQYPLPLLIILIAYIKIGIYMRRHKVPQQHSNVFKGKTLRNETRKDSIAMTKTVGAIVVLFAILLLPLQITRVAIYHQYKKLWVFILQDYGDVFSTMHSAINPYLYTIRSPACRSVIWSWFRKQPVLLMQPTHPNENSTVNTTRDYESSLHSSNAHQNTPEERRAKDYKLESKANTNETKL